MIIEQQHIINKVFLEVKTNSNTIAHDLKDNLNMFLKENILPYLEDYFKSVEPTLPAEIIQIPQLTLDINVTNQDNFKELKTATKEKLVQKIDTLLKSSSEAKEDIVLINGQEHQTRSLLFFIENGYTPWWKSAENKLQFTRSEITEIATHTSFTDGYRKLLQNPICKKRAIQQFNDQELQIFLKACFKNTTQINVLHNDVIRTFTSLSTLSRTFIWSELISYLQTQNTTSFIENTASVLIKNGRHLDDTVYAFAKAYLAILQQLIKISKSDIITALHAKSSKKDIAKVDASLASQLIPIYENLDLSKEAYKILHSVIPSRKSDVVKPNKAKENPIKSITNDEHKIGDDTTIDEAKTITAIDDFKKDNSLQNKENEASLLQSIEDNKNKLSTSKKESTQKEYTDTTTPVAKSEKADHKTEVVKSTENSEAPIAIDKTEKIDNNDIVSKPTIDNPLQTSETSQNQALNKDTSEKEHSEKTNLSDGHVASQDQQKNDNLKTIDTYIKEIATQQEEFIITDTGSFYVPNAGLIILHPYLKQFFSNCGIIDENNSIKDVDLAIHTLHYLATKKEQQLESQMPFEKFLCGIPIKTPIKRHIQLSDIIKEQAEELLTSVIENWGILNNASTDLLRHEFLQRQGKLSFKEDNPKIVIERKTQDILVDRLPWGIGICRLPWLDHLVFTNW